MVVIDGVTRLLPGALGHEDSADQDSFMNGLLDYPHYTRPEQIDQLTVPPVLLSGDHQAIARWRLKQALGRTWLRRPDLLETMQLDELQRDLLEEFIREQGER
jgi:tRNA (guanine37-N1)-methyltransferase